MIKSIIDKRKIIVWEVTIIISCFDICKKSKNNT